MSDPLHPHREHPNTYMVQDHSNQEEMARLKLQEDLFTLAMGGLLPEQPDPKAFKRVLDVGCGTGGWLIELAKTYPHMTRLIGVDISNTMLKFARAQAEAAGVSDRVEFIMMDALRMLEFPNKYFDLVNQRLGNSYLRSWDWPKLLQEYKRVCDAFGVIRITESDMTGESNSPTLNRLFRLLLAAFSQAGHLFKPDSKGITDELAGLLTRHDIHNVQTRTFSLDQSAGTPGGQLCIENLTHLFRTLKPFIQKWVRLPDNYDQLYQQMLQEINQPDFICTGNALTAWGQKI